MKDILITVVEHPNYLKRAEKILTAKQMNEIVDIVASEPDAGSIMQGTGGFRKLRYAGVENKGKSGGVRIIYFFVTQRGKVHLLHVYGKGEKDNLTQAEKNELADIAKILKET